MKKLSPKLLTPLSAVLVIAGCLGVFYLVGIAQSAVPAIPSDPTEAALAKKKTVAPPIDGTTIDGKPFHLSDYRGKVVLINFWATWCGPCKMEIPDLIALQKKYESRGFTVVGVGDDEPERMKPFVAQAGMNYPVLKMPAGVSQAYGINGIPFSVLIDRNGVATYLMEGVDPEQKMDELWSKHIDKIL